jgi:hypothetical protein
MADISVRYAFEDTGAVHALTAQFAAEKSGEQFNAEGAVLQLRLPEVAVDRLKIALRDATRDRARVCITK